MIALQRVRQILHCLLSIDDVYHIVENSLLALLIIRFFWITIDRKRFSKDHVVVFIFSAFLVVNSVLYEGLTALQIPWHCMYYFMHAYLPPLVISMLVLKKLIWIPRLILAILVGTINYYFEYDAVIILIYYLAVWLALREGYRMSKQRSIELSRSVVYIAIAIDMFATMIILVLRVMDFNWHESQLIQYIHYLRLAIFLTTIITLHVKLRRFIVA
jgi:hypothetical protein